MPENQFYTGAHLDRASTLRRDDSWVEAQRRDGSPRVLAVWRDRNLMAPGDDPEAHILHGDAARAVLDAADHVGLLGIDGDEAYFAADLSSHEEPALPDAIGSGAFVDLRQTGPLMSRRDGNLLAHARGLMYWRRHNGFCGNCGSATRSRGGGGVLSCTNTDCGREHFPRTDPAVIMLVTRDDPDGDLGGGACLLARSPRFLEGMYSTLAGFVDQSESLEEAVVREVKEEAGIVVTDATYMASQPWPFPASLMLGFRARAVSVDIAYDTDELADAQWFTRADIANFEDMGKRLPRTDSIARWLVDTWLAEGNG
jgi:NAD+ diphosphatase